MNNVIEISDDESKEAEDDGEPESPKLFKHVNLFNLEEEFEVTSGSGVVAKAFTSAKDTLSQNLHCSPRPTCYNVNGLEGNEIQGNGMATVPEQSCDYPKTHEKGEDTFLTSTQDLFVTQKNCTSDLLEDEHDVIIISDDDSVDEDDNVGGGDKRDADDSGANDGDDGLEISQDTPSDNSQSSMIIGASLSPWLNKASFSQTFLFKDEEHDEDSASSQKTTDKNCISSGTVPTCQVLATQTKPNKISRTNSFDTVPRQASQEFAHYQPTRKKDERQKLDGDTCSQCYPYYKSLSKSEEEMKENVNRSSRHRERFRAPPSPEGFWDLGFPESDQEKQDEEEIDTLLSSSPTHHRRRIHLEKKFKSKSEEEAAMMQSQQEPQRSDSKD